MRCLLAQFYPRPAQLYSLSAQLHSLWAEVLLQPEAMQAHKLLHSFRRVVEAEKVGLALVGDRLFEWGSVVECGYGG